MHELPSSSPGRVAALEPIAETMADIRSILMAEEGAIRGAKGAPVFLEGGARFLYQPDGPGGLSVDLVDPVRRSISRLVGEEDLKAALTGLKIDLTQLSVDGAGDREAVIYFSSGETMIAFDLTAKRARIDPERAAWARLHRPRIISDQFPTTFGDLIEAASPDGRRFITQREANLWVRDLDGCEQQLTADGGPDLIWGGTQESAQTFNVLWAPDGEKIAAVLLDNRDTPHEPLMRYMSRGATVTTWPYSRVGDPISRFTLYVIDTASAERVRLDAGDTDDHYVDLLGWSADGAAVYYQVVDRAHKTVEFRRADATSGASRTLRVERSSSYIDTPFTLGPPLLRPLEHAEGFLMFCEREAGFRQLYLHDGDGRRIRLLGPDVGLVYKIVSLDDAHGRVFVMAAARDERPYDRALYCLPLDGGAARRLTPGPGFREVWPAPDGSAFVVRTADPNTPPSVTVIDPFGNMVVEVSTADVSRLRAMGFDPPETFATRSGDGRSEVRGLILKPFGFDPSRRYPIVEMIYGGMQVSHTPKSYYGFERLGMGYNSVPARVLLHYGFVVVYADAPGTPDRGRAYQDATYGVWPQTVVSNHAHWLQEAARARPWMDIGRVGVFGNSWGGLMSARALVEAPDLYKVAVVMTAAGDLDDHSNYIEPFMGMASANRRGYAAGSILDRLKEICGRALVIGFPEDVNAGFSPTMKLVAGLIEAQRDFDMLVIPGMNHHIDGRGAALATYGYAVITRYFRQWLKDGG